MRERKDIEASQTLTDRITVITLPKDVASDVRSYFRFFEVDNIRDLLENYDELAKPRVPPKSYRKWSKAILQRHYEQMHSKQVIAVAAPAFTESSEGIVTLADTPEAEAALAEYWTRLRDCRLYDLLIGGTGNFRYASIDNVALRNFSFIGKDLFEACESDVCQGDDSIRAVFIYRVLYQDRLYGPEKDQLVKVLSTNATTTFDLMFKALDPEYNVAFRKGKYEPRGRKLLVLNMNKRYDGDTSDEKDPTPTPREKIDSPLLQMV